MSEYAEVEQPFLAQLAAQGWEVIDQGSEIRGECLQTLLKEFAPGRVFLHLSASDRPAAFNNPLDAIRALRHIFIIIPPSSFGERAQGRFRKVSALAFFMRA